MKQRDLQIRENIEETEYTLDVIEGDEITGRNALLIQDAGLELWTERDDFGGYVIVIDGIGYAFVRSL